MHTTPVLEQAGRARDPRWAWFLGQQSAVFIVGAAALAALRGLTGRDVHGLRAAPTWTEFGGYLVLVGLFVWGTTRALARATRGGAPPLGITFSVKRVLVMLAAFAIGFVWNAAPWLLAVWQGEVRFTALEPAPAAAAISLGLALGLSNAFFEESVIRAYVMQLWHERSIFFRVSVSALAFTLQHFGGEAPSVERFLYLAALGVVLGVVFAFRRHVDASTGLHAGWFYATLVPAGRPELGSWLALEGDLRPALASADLVLELLALLGLVWMAVRALRAWR